jgi:hypothetical protein
VPGHTHLSRSLTQCCGVHWAGDILQVSAGERVAADMRVLEVQDNCQVDAAYHGAYREAETDV